MLGKREQSYETVAAKLICTRQAYTVCMRSGRPKVLHKLGSRCLLNGLIVKRASYFLKVWLMVSDRHLTAIQSQPFFFCFCNMWYCAFLKSRYHLAMSVSKYGTYNILSEVYLYSDLFFFVLHVCCIF